jgi:hypothetical protein
MAAHRNCALCPVGGRRRLLGVEAGDGPIWKDYFACSADIATTHENCSVYLSQRLADADTYKWKVAALTGLAPIPIAWLLVYGLIGLVRWIRQGFKAT